MERAGVTIRQGNAAMSARGSSTKAPSSKVFAALLVGTRTGAFIVRGDSSRRRWTLSESIFPAHIVHHLVLDPRDGQTILMPIVPGIWVPPSFAPPIGERHGRKPRTRRLSRKVSEGQTGLIVDHVFWLTPGHPSESQDGMPDRLYQQNHCGIYRMDRPEGRWVRIGDNMPKQIGDISFPIVLHPRDTDRVWVFPDGRRFRMAAGESRRKTGPLRDAQRRQ